MPWRRPVPRCSHPRRCHRPVCSLPSGRSTTIPSWALCANSRSRPMPTCWGCPGAPSSRRGSRPWPPSRSRPSAPSKPRTPCRSRCTGRSTPHPRAWGGIPTGPRSRPSERLRVFRSCPLTTPERTHSALQMRAIARAMAVLCALIGHVLARYSVTPEKLSASERLRRTGAPELTADKPGVSQPRIPCVVDQAITALTGRVTPSHPHHKQEMNMSREVVVVSAARTAIGTYGGSLKDTPPTELAALVVKETLARAGVDGKDVGHVVFGHVVNTEPKDMYLSRVAAVNGGCAEGTPAFNVNRLCGSGLQAIISASQAIMLGDCDIAIGGGAENMSRGPYASLSARWGARMGDTKMVDMVVGALHDPFHTIHMGVTAENVAAKFGISRV